METEQRLYKESLQAIKEKNYEEAVSLLKQLASFKGDIGKRGAILFYAVEIIKECQRVLQPRLQDVGQESKS